MDKLQPFLLIGPVLLYSVVAHEYAHGYAALKNGDSTAHDLGRLTWNPIKHIDPILTIAMPIMTYLAAGFIFGGAKPVPVNPANYRRLVRGDIIVSLAGIFVNLCLAVICTLLIIVLGWIGRVIPALGFAAGVLQAMMFIGVMLNLVLAFFNLIPIPPLDGSHVFKYLLPVPARVYYERLGFLGIILLLFFLSALRPFYLGPVNFFHDISVRATATSFLPESLDLLRNVGMLR